MEIPMPRIGGRIIRPSNLSERRILKNIGVDFLRVRRGENPFVAMRVLQRLASASNPDLVGLKKMIEIDRERRPHFPLPPNDLPYCTNHNDVVGTPAA
jgi:hypothetical protein